VNECAPTVSSVYVIGEVHAAGYEESRLQRKVSPTSPAKANVAVVLVVVVNGALVIVAACAGNAGRSAATRTATTTNTRLTLRRVMVAVDWGNDRARYALNTHQL